MFAAESSRTRVLVVEDNRTQRTKLHRTLKSAGYDVESVPDGQQAIEALVAAPYDMVLTDIVMPRLSGYDLCRHIKTDSRLKDTPVILLTSLGKPTDIIRGLQCVWWTALSTSPMRHLTSWDECVTSSRTGGSLARLRTVDGSKSSLWERDSGSIQISRRSSHSLLRHSKTSSAPANASTRAFWPRSTTAKRSRPNVSGRNFCCGKVIICAGEPIPSVDSRRPEIPDRHS